MVKIVEGYDHDTFVTDISLLLAQGYAVEGFSATRHRQNTYYAAILVRSTR